MTNAEHKEYLSGIMAKLVDGSLSSTELFDLGSSLGLTLDDWYYPKTEKAEQAAAVEVIQRHEVKWQAAA